MTDGRTSRWLLLCVLAGLLAGTPALATNGMYLAGYGAEAAGRGGANIAIADRALGLQSNPAGIAQLQGNHLSVDLQFLAPELHYNGPYGDIDGEDRVFAMPSISYVRGGGGVEVGLGDRPGQSGRHGRDFQGLQHPRDDDR
jgi:long-subunit fatty acid transport protein